MKKLVFIWLLFLSISLLAQDSISKEKKWNLSGYLKDLHSLNFNKDFRHVDYTNLVHNRLNLKWSPNQKLDGRLEVRNRFYWGDAVRIIPGFNRQLRNSNEWTNLSAVWISTDNATVQSNIERLSLEWRQNKWNIRAGRQRLNWGIANTWNPNDIFNTYNFLDFDYEERPGSDALKYQYLVSDLSNMEVAFAATNNNTIAAARYFTNYKKYDLQFNAGKYLNYFTAGFGWAGSISDAGFKGEAQFYTNKRDSANHFNLTLEGDYSFKKGWYVSSAILYNRRGLDSSINDWSKISFQISPQHLMPSRWNLLLNSSKEFTPLFTGSISVIYSPHVNMLILFPSLTYNLQTNLDLAIFWQSFFTQLASKFQGVSHNAFIRLKWSF